MPPNNFEFPSVTGSGNHLLAATASLLPSSPLPQPFFAAASFTVATRLAEQRTRLSREKVKMNFAMPEPRFENECQLLTISASTNRKIATAIQELVHIEINTVG